MLNKWVRDWRESYLPQLSKAELEALLKGLIEDDPALIQGNTALPLHTSSDKIEAGCALCYAIWRGRKVNSLVYVERAFNEMLCYNADTLLPEQSFLNWFDFTPRDMMRSELISEIKYNLQELSNVQSKRCVASRNG